MRLNYKRLGDYIKQVKEKNTEGLYDELLGINIDKYFMPSVANVIGTNLSRYKVVKRNQFACNRMHVGRDERIPIALSVSEKPFIVSPAYTVFEIRDTSVLLPEYLMMWFSRPEFDRECWFHTDADVRGGLPWGLFTDIEIPIPSIEKQHEIVKEYNTVVNRIKLNEQLNQKLEETAQALYKHWFVDFEFPNDEGKPYKSSGGEMEYNKELNIEIPVGWEFKSLDFFCDCFDNMRKPLSSEEREKIPGKYPYYGAMSIVDYINDFIYDGIYLLVSEDGVNVVDERGRPATQYVYGKFWLNNHAHILKGRNSFSTEYLKLALSFVNAKHLVTGAAQPKINQKNLMSIQLLNSDPALVNLFDIKIQPLFKKVIDKNEENNFLEEIKGLLLSKMTRVEVKQTEDII